MTEYRIAKASELAPGTTRYESVDGNDILLCNVAGTIYAIEDVCSHDGAPLDQGCLEGACIVCPRHGATFDVRTGAALTLPAIMPVLTFPTRIDGDDVIVSL